MAPRPDLEKQKFELPTGGLPAIRTMSQDFYQYRSQSTVTFAAATTGTVAAHTIFTVTGLVALSIVAKCGTDLAGASATIEVGTALSTPGLIAQTTATNIDANEIWHDATPDASIELTSVMTKKIVSQDIAYKIGTAAVSGGVLTFYVFWTPLSSDGNVVAA